MAAPRKASIASSASHADDSASQKSHATANSSTPLFKPTPSPTSITAQTGHELANGFPNSGERNTDKRHSAEKLVIHNPTTPLGSSPERPRAAKEGPKTRRCCNWQYYRLIGKLAAAKVKLGVQDGWTWLRYNVLTCLPVDVEETLPRKDTSQAATGDDEKFAEGLPVDVEETWWGKAKPSCKKQMTFEAQEEGAKPVQSATGQLQPKIVRTVEISVTEEAERATKSWRRWQIGRNGGTQEGNTRKAQAEGDGGGCR